MKNINIQFEQKDIQPVFPAYASASNFNDYKHSEDNRAFLLKGFKE